MIGNVYEAGFVVDDNFADGVAGDGCEMSDGGNDFTGFDAMFASAVEAEAGHARFLRFTSATCIVMRVFVFLGSIVKFVVVRVGAAFFGTATFAGLFALFCFVT